MNNFAGIIHFNTSAEQTFLQELQLKFPRRLAGMQPLQEGQLNALGKFEVSALNNSAPQQLYFEGELYNGDELARSLAFAPPAPLDAPTLLHTLILEKGLDAIAAVNGQFLLVYIDSATQTVQLLNDHSGVNQVFYYQFKDFFLFASDIKFLLAHPQCPCKIDWNSSLRRPHGYTVMYSYRNYGTWFQDIYLLPEATVCSIHWGSKEIKQRKYWNGLYDYAPPSATDKRSTEEVMEEYMSLLDDAVKIRIQDISEAHSFLSGGLDSSVICAMAAKGKALHSYSIVTQTTVIEGTTSICHDLAKDLSFTNEQFLIPYHELIYDKQRWKQRIWRTENPVNHTDALTKNLLHYGISNHHTDVPYVLSGTGSDQYNGGLVRWVMNDDDDETVSAEAFLNKVKDAGLQGFVGRDEDTYWRMRKVLRPEFIAEAAGGKLQSNYWMYYVQSALHGESYSLLWDELRAASAHSRSVRFPFLDYRFAQFFASVPERLHRELFYDKQILRTRARKLLPAYVTDKKKQPAFIPGYDFRFRLFDELTSGPDSILIQAFGDRSTPHAVIDKEQLWARVAAMKQKPEIYEWQELIHIINLGLLEQLAGKDETDLDFETKLHKPERVHFTGVKETVRSLQQRLSVKTEEELIALPLQWVEGCRLMQHLQNAGLFIAKHNTLAYELEDEYVGWITFLKDIDGRRSTADILGEHDISFEEIRDFFMLALKEQILSFGEEADAIAKAAVEKSAKDKLPA